jgi:hypothetical protein
MSNRFTDDLLALQHALISSALIDVLQLYKPTSTFTKYLWPVIDVTSSPEEYSGISDTMICLLAAMSDADIDELVINWTE